MKRIFAMLALTFVTTIAAASCDDSVNDIRRVISEEGTLSIPLLDDKSQFVEINSIGSPWLVDRIVCQAEASLNGVRGYTVRWIGYGYSKRWREFIGARPTYDYSNVPATEFEDCRKKLSCL